MTRKISIAVTLGLLGLLGGCTTTEHSADTNTSWVGTCGEANPCESGECVAGNCVAATEEIEEWDVALSLPDRQGGQPTARWQGDRFVVSWVGMTAAAVGKEVVKAELSPDGTHTQVAAPYAGHATRTAVDEAGRVAVTAHSTFGASCNVQVFEPDLASAGSFDLDCGSEAAVGPLGDGTWAVARGEHHEGTDLQTVIVEQLDPSSSTPLSGRVPVGTTSSDLALTLFTLDDRAIVPVPTGTSSVLTHVEGLGSPGGGAASGVTIPGADAAYGLAYGVGRVEGRTLLFGADAASVWVADVTDGAPPGAVKVVASSGIGDRPIGAAGAPELGVVGVCYGTGAGPGGGSTLGGGDGVAFVAVDSNGDVVSGPTIIDEGFYNIGGCDVAWSGAEFVVAYWRIEQFELPAGSGSLVRARRIVPAL